MASRTWIDHLGHTSFGVGRGDTRILIDPILARPDLEFREPVYADWFYADLDRVDAVLISHGHNDHLHPPSLLGLPPDTPIYFLDEDLSTCSCDEDPRQLLPHLGFTDIRPFVPGDVVEVGDGLKVHAIPAAPSTEGEEQVCFLVESPDVLMLDGVDIRDAAETRRALEPFRGRIDLAFVPTGAALQWQGFWNQMDQVEAVELCRWLEPARIAACGGSLSLAHRPRPGDLERYPDDLESWLRTVHERLGDHQVFVRRPPFRLFYESGELVRWAQLPAGTELQPGTGGSERRALLASFFTGYDPRLPSQRLTWVDSGMERWLGRLAPLARAIERSETQIRHLLERCGPSQNQTPAAVFADTALRRLMEAGDVSLAARLCALCPPPPAAGGEGSRELLFSFFAVADALVEEAAGDLDDVLAEDLRAALWIDRWLFELRLVHIRLRSLVSYPEDLAASLRRDHRDTLRQSRETRRPVPGVNTVRVGERGARLLFEPGDEPSAAGALIFPSPAGVHRMPLSAAEAGILRLCDGRTFGEVVDAVAEVTDADRDAVDGAVFDFLAKLTHSSVLAIDWSS